MTLYGIGAKIFESEVESISEVDVTNPSEDETAFFERFCGVYERRHYYFGLKKSIARFEGKVEEAVNQLTTFIKLNTEDLPELNMSLEFFKALGAVFDVTLWIGDFLPSQEAVRYVYTWIEPVLVVHNVHCSFTKFKNMTYDFVQIGKTLVEKHTTIDEMDIHGEITRMPNCWFKLLPVMIAQQGAMFVVSGSHMAETDGETFSRLTSKLKGSDIKWLLSS